MNFRSRIIGTGSYLPERILTNDQIAETLDTSDKWITERTGIRQRHIAADNETTADIAYESAIRALEMCRRSIKEIDLIVLATSTPDNTFPSTATKVQAMLGMHHGAAFDIQAVCSGFVYALAIGDNFIKSGQAKRVLVIGAETFSRILDWKDRTTCVLFGDGGGAVVLEKQDGENGILSTHLHSDGRFSNLLYVDGGPSTTKSVGHIRMSGREVFRHAVVNLASVVDEALKKNNFQRSDIDWLVPHQANLRILSSTARKLGLVESQVIITVHRHANTSAASIPLALDEAIKDGKIKEGHLVLMEAMGGGFTWGAALIRW